MPFNPLEHPIVLLTPQRLSPTTVAGSLPFGMLIVDLLRPSTIVELGTGAGVTYCGFCQAVSALGLDARCTGIDAWTTASASVSTPQAFRELRAFHDARYGRFSRLLDGAPVDLLGAFPAGSIDLLHVADGCDDQTKRRLVADWLPKLSRRGVLLLSNTSQPASMRIWRDLRLLHPHFELRQGRGLGVAAVGRQAVPALAPLLDTTPAEQAGIQEFFARISEPIQALADLDHATGTEQVEPLTQTVRVLEGHLTERGEAVDWLQSEIAELRRRRRALEGVIESLASQLDEIFTSRGWRALMWYRRLRARLGIPAPRSVRRRAVRPASAPVEEALQTTVQALISAPAPDTYEALTLLPALRAEEAETVLRLHRADHRGYDVVCFSIIDWEFRYQRPQQIMSQFAAHGHRVFYISTSRFQQSESGPSPRVRLIRENVWEVQLATSAPVDVYGDPHPEAIEDSLHASLDALRREYDISSAVSYVMIASWTATALAARSAWRWPVLYDCMDEWENFPGIRPAILAAERTLVDQCDLLVVTGARLEEKWRGRRGPLVLSRNGVDAEFYASRCRPNARLDVPHPIVGYYGAIADWFDIDLMTRVARARPQYHFVLLGGVFGVDVRALEALPNVSLLGQQPYSTMPEYAYHFDVCLIPFKVNAITDATDPVKLYEYLSAGKPVVSVSLAEIEPYRDLIYLAADGDDFLVQLDRAVAERDPALAARRREFASENNWADRYERIDTALGATSLASVIVVTFNNLALTKLCLESLLRNAEYPRHEVIVVDNASTDGTPTYLRHMESTHPEVRVVLNDENLGFPRANNQGLAISRGDYVVLLNNDTVVPPGWLSRLVGHLQDPEVGLVGPVTNFVGNEAKVEVGYRTWGEMEQFARDRARRHDGQRADIHMLAMFCLAMRRDVFERLGPLDERFGIGMFEDDDYARRARAAGYRVVCAADAFIHHVGQAAFKTLIQNGKYDALFDRNRRAYEQKWGVAWTPHRHARLTFELRGETTPDAVAAES